MATVAQQKVVINTGESTSFIPFGYVVDQRDYVRTPTVSVSAPTPMSVPMLTSNYTVTHKFLPDGTVLATIKLQVSDDSVADKYEVRVSEVAG